MERGNTPDVESDEDGDDANGDAKNGAGNVQRGDGATILKSIALDNAAAKVLVSTICL